MSFFLHFILDNVYFLKKINKIIVYFFIFSRFDISGIKIDISGTKIDISIAKLDINYFAKYFFKKKKI